MEASTGETRIFAEGIQLPEDVSEKPPCVPPIGSIFPGAGSIAVAVNAIESGNYEAPELEEDSESEDE